MSATALDFQDWETQGGDTDGITRTVCHGCDRMWPLAAMTEDSRFDNVCPECVATRGEEVKRLTRRLRAARWRLRHYAGIPFIHLSGRDDPLEYETALDDCNALADAIASLGRPRPETPDIKKEFMARASLALGKAIMETLE